MKKIIAIFLLALYVLSATEAHQLLKMPYIFQHFSDHRNANKNITFLQFLDMHYLHGSPRDKDYQDDMKLPFKSDVECSAMLSVAYIPITNPVSEIKTVELSKLKVMVFNEGHIPSTYLSSVWQPPKFC